MTFYGYQDFFGTEEVGDAPQTEVVAEIVVILGILIGEYAVLAMVGLSLGHFHPHVGGVVLLCLGCAERHCVE